MGAQLHVDLLVDESLGLFVIVLTAFAYHFLLEICFFFFRKGKRKQSQCDCMGQGESACSLTGEAQQIEATTVHGVAYIRYR